MDTQRRILVLNVCLLRIAVFGSDIHVVNVPPKGEISINCKNSSTLQILDIMVNQKTTECKHRSCNASEEVKNVIIDHCNGKHSCALFADVRLDCLQNNGYFNLSYSCKASLLDCDFRINFCKWANAKSWKWKWHKSYYIHFTGYKRYAACLVYQTFHTSSESCLKINIHIPTNRQGEINLYVNKHKIGNSSLLGSGWKEIDIPELGNLNFSLEGICHLCQIKIYDIKLLPGRCSGDGFPVYTCYNEVQTCRLVQVKSMQRQLLEYGIIHFLGTACNVGKDKYLQSCLPVEKTIKIPECGDKEVYDQSFNFVPAIEGCNYSNIIGSSNVANDATDKDNPLILDLTETMEAYPDCFKVNRLSVTYECEDSHLISTSSEFGTGQTSELTNAGAEVTDSMSPYVPQEKEPNSFDVVPLVGVVLGMLVLVSFVVLSVILLRRRHKKKEITQNFCSGLEESDQIHSYSEIDLNTQPTLNSGISTAVVNSKKPKLKTKHKNNEHSNEDVHPTNAVYNHIDWNSAEEPTRSNSTDLNLNINPAFQTNSDGNYNILDPQATGYDRTEATDNYELALPISSKNDNYVMNSDDRNEQNMLKGEETYNTTMSFDHGEEDGGNVYSHSVDTVYDTANHDRSRPVEENNYDHFIGNKINTP